MSSAENDIVDGSEDRPSHERNISDLLNDIGSASASAVSQSEIDFSKVDISKIPLELLTNNVNYIQKLSSSNLLPDGLQNIIENHEGGDEKLDDNLEPTNSGSLAVLRASDSMRNDEENQLGNKLREAFKTINCREDGKIIIDLVSFITGLRVLGMNKIEKKEIGRIFADFCEDNSTEIDVEKIISDILEEKTKRIRKLKERLSETLGIMNPVKELQLQLDGLRSRMVQKSLRCLELENEKKRRDSKENQSLRDLETKNRLLDQQIRSLRENLVNAQTQYKIDLTQKAEELDILQGTLNRSEDMNGILQEQLNQSAGRKSSTTPLSIRQQEDELNLLRTKSYEAEKQFRVSLEEANTRANKYRTKYDNLKEQTAKTFSKWESERSDLIAEVQTLRFQLRIMEEKSKDYKRPLSAKKSRIANARSSFEESKRSNERTFQAKDKRVQNVGNVETDFSSLFLKRQKITVGNSGMQECTTLWRFLCSDMSKHSIRLIHVQASKDMDAQAKCRRVIMVDGEEHYNKRSNSKNYLFEIRSDEVRVTIGWENSSWNYKLMINGQSFQNAQRNFHISEK